MTAQGNMLKGRAASKMSSQQAAFELKQRVVLALSKLADRDTYQIGVEELDKTVECLTSDGFSTFLSCILDTDSEQKSAVRKECIRLMGTLVTFHEGFVGSYLGKMVAGIVKRLKDADSVVRDACIDTVGILASKLSSSRFETDGVFASLVRPLFEALGEQNKTVQSGSALCLSRVIDNIHDPPPLVLQKMLSKTIKLLNNTHFMAKPAVVELNRSIILAGGAPTHSSLTAALTSIQEALKSSDWATRKAACIALGEIASCGVACLGSFRGSSIRCLESCRFDKVKPVRDVALQALQLWRNLPGSNTPEPSEAAFSVKDSYSRDYGDVTSASDSTLKGTAMLKTGSGTAKRRGPIPSRKANRNYIEKPQQSKANDWQIEIAIPRSHGSADQNDESEGSSITKRCQRIGAEVRNLDVSEYDYVEVQDKQEFSSVSNTFSESLNSRVVSACFDGYGDISLVKSTGTSQRFVAGEISLEEQRYLSKIHDCRSLDSTVTELTSTVPEEQSYLSKMLDRRSLDSTVTDSTLPIPRDSYSRTENDIVSIKKQLLEIENKQMNMMDMLKTFTSGIMDSMSMVQSKVSHLELVVDKIAQTIVNGEKHTHVLANKLVKSSNTDSPRLSTCTSRSSIRSNTQPPLIPAQYATEENKFSRNRTSCGRQSSEMVSDVTFKPSKISLGRESFTSFQTETCGDQIRKNENIIDSSSSTKTRPNKLGIKNSQWTVMKEYLFEGNVDSAYAEALCSRNELLLFELLGRTGPVLENLSQKTATDLLSTLASYLLEHRFVNSIIPWLQQLVDLSDIHGPTYLVLSAKAKRDFLFAIQGAAKLDVFSPAERKFFIELGKLLRQNWGDESFC